MLPPGVGALTTLHVLLPVYHVSGIVYGREESIHIISDHTENNIPIYEKQGNTKRMVKLRLDESWIKKSVVVGCNNRPVVQGMSKTCEETGHRKQTQTNLSHGWDGGGKKTETAANNRTLGSSKLGSNGNFGQKKERDGEILMAAGILSQGQCL